MAINYIYTSARYAHQIDYNTQGGSSVSSNGKDVNSSNASVSVSVAVNDTVPTRTGYTFSKWNKKADGTGTNYAAGASISHTFTRQATLNKTVYDPTTGDTDYYYITSPQNYYTTLYAIWAINTYTVSYNKGSNGTGTNTSATKTYGQDLTLKGAIFTRTGYTQTGWATSDGGAKVYNLSGTYAANAAVTLYPFWTVNTYTVSYNANGGSGAPSAQTKTYGVNLTLSNTTPTRTGYTFLGWSTSNTATAATYSAGGSYTSNASATLYAVWSIITYTVSYNKGSNGTGTNTTATKTYNVALSLKGAIFTRTGYVQDGWATSDGGASVYALSSNYTANASVTLYPHWKATVSVISTGNGTLGTAQTITITRYNNSFTHDLTYKYGSLTGTIATGVGTSYSWTPTESLAAAFPSAKSGVCTITCTTKNGGTTVGTSTTTCTLTIPSSVKCTVASVAVAETVAGLNAKFGALIQGKSKASLTGTINSGSGSPAYGATVTAYSITTNGQTLKNNGATTGVLNTSGSNSYSFKITDTRGYTHTKTGTYTVLAYSAPSITAEVQRNESDATKIDVSYSYAISSCNNKNDKALTIKYKKTGGSYTTVNVSITQYSASGTYQLTGIDANSLYEVIVTATDYFGSVQNVFNVPPVGNRVFDISATDKTVARHMSNPSDGWDHQAFNEQFHGIIDVLQRRAYATLSTPGWYRVFTGTFSTSAQGNGSTGLFVDFNIVRHGSSIGAESHTITCRTRNGGNSSFLCEESYAVNSGQVLIDKIRHTRNDNVTYFDIHYSGSAANIVSVYFNTYTALTYQKMIASNNLSAVADSPSGETVLSEHSFIANTNVSRTTWTPTFGGTASLSVGDGTYYYSVKNGVFYAGGRFKIDSFTSGAYSANFTLPISLGGSRGVEVIGTMFKPTKTLVLRWTGSSVLITNPGGDYAGGLLETGYWAFQIVTPVQ